MEKKKLLGALLGLAVGDALGAPVEFKKRNTYPIVTDMQSGGFYNLKPGEWTDDTSMALCLSRSLSTKKQFDPHDIMNRFTRWWQCGYMSSRNVCFDIGDTTKRALLKWSEEETLISSTDSKIDKKCDGNGTIMRLAPVPIFFRNDIEQAIRYSHLQSTLTHVSDQAADACMYMAGIILGALEGESKIEILKGCYYPTQRQWAPGVLHPQIENIAMGSFKDKIVHDIQSTGYVAHTLEAALWAFWNSQSFEEGMIMAVNLGKDTDTIGAVYGQVAGAFYGISSIPEKWINALAKKEMLIKEFNALMST
jgi:ADP-ribosylglycohydrolase